MHNGPLPTTAGSPNGTAAPDARLAAALVEALKRALAEPGEQRLFRSGKLAGLFAGRGGASAQAAAEALRRGLLEVVRTEQRGKTAVEWVRLTPAGVDYLHAHESPRAVLAELRAALATSRAGLPLWTESLRADFDDFLGRLTEEVRQVQQRLDALDQRVEAALRRLDAAGPAVSDGVMALVPWALDALTYLDRRNTAGAGACPLPELFAALYTQHPGLSLTAFHDGLRRLRDAGALTLTPFADPPELMSEPEYALPDGARFLYYASR
jgi:hypothetical protein